MLPLILAASGSTIGRSASRRTAARNVSKGTLRLESDSLATTSSRRLAAVSSHPLDFVRPEYGRQAADLVLTRTSGARVLAIGACHNMRPACDLQVQPPHWVPLV